jgi:hypothetical protein
VVAEKGEAVGETMGGIGLMFGGIFLLIAIVGGGFTAKELTVPKVPTWARAASFIVGTFLLTGSLYSSLVAKQGDLNRSSTGSTSSEPGPTGPSGHQCRSPHEVPSIAEGDHSEDDVKQLLQARGFFNVLVDADVTHPGTPNGIVVAQKPAPGTIICPRDPVTITVTK